MIRWKAYAAASILFACTWAQAADNVPHWGYEGHGGADHWYELDKAFEVCKLGKTQSPIDIMTPQVESVAGAPIKPAYKSSPATLANNGHTIVVNLADGGTVTVPSGTYKAVQFHFHTPSEEKIDGKSFPMVAHIVHSNDAGKLAVIAVLFNEGAENAALKEIFAALPAQQGEQPIKPFDTTALLRFRGIADDAAVQRGGRVAGAEGTGHVVRGADRGLPQDIPDERASGAAAQRTQGHRNPIAPRGGGSPDWGIRLSPTTRAPGQATNPPGFIRQGTAP